MSTGSGEESISAQLAAAYENRPVLVTGGASFIGSHLAELLLRAGARVRVVDNFSSGRREHLDGVRDDVELVVGDLRDHDVASAAARGQEVVFHLAAAHGGRGYIDTHPVECTNNMVLDHIVFDAAARAGVHRTVFASSACVYPTDLQSSETEHHLLRESDADFEERGKAFADGEYGWAKLMGELQLKAFQKQYGMSGVACRIFTSYGERENETHAVIALIAKAVARLDPFPIWGNGEQTRNFTYVLDTVTGLALGGSRLDGFDTINVGTSKHQTILELIEQIFSFIEWRPAEILRELDRPVGVKSRAADNDKSDKLLGWSPSIDLPEGVARTVDWYVRNVEHRSGAELESLLLER